MFSIERKSSDLVCNSIEIEKEITPYTLFHKIRNELLKNQILLEKLLDNVDKRLLGGINTYLQDNLIQSCTVNFYFLSMCFVGEKRTKQIHKALSLTISEIVDILLDKRGEPIKVLFHHFLSGNEVLRQNKEYAAKGDLYKFSVTEIIQSFDFETDYVKYLNIFKEKVTDLYEGKEVADLHKFCEPVLDSLKNELIVNSKTVANDCSYIYHISITMPCTLKGTGEQILKAPIGHYHSFILEQYYSDEKGGVFTRLHQSWKNEFTLLEHYNNMGYGDKDEGCFDSYELDDFIENLKGLLMCGNQPEINRGYYQNACFNVYKEDVLPTGFFRIEANIFSGKSIRFMTSKINPTESINDFKKFIQNYS